MEGRLIVLFATLTVFVASGVQGTSHLSFSNNTEVNITRDGCGITKLCLETPMTCDPSTNSTCLFASIFSNTPVVSNSLNLSVELRGDIADSMGYIAMGLTRNAEEGSTMLFVCAYNGSANQTFFRTLTRNNTSGMLTPVEIRVSEIRIMQKDKIIRCEFDIPSLNTTATRYRNSDANTFRVLLGSGPLDTNGAGGIGSFNVTLKSDPLNLIDPTNSTSNNATTTAAPSNMTTVPTTTGSSDAVHPHALLILLSVLTLFTMLRA